MDKDHEERDQADEDGDVDHTDLPAGRGTIRGAGGVVRPHGQTSSVPRIGPVMPGRMAGMGRMGVPQVTQTTAPISAVLAGDRTW
jgi:hypothetical protein